MRISLTKLLKEIEDGGLPPEYVGPGMRAVSARSLQYPEDDWNPPVKGYKTTSKEDLDKKVNMENEITKLINRNRSSFDWKFHPYGTYLTKITERENALAAALVETQRAIVNYVNFCDRNGFGVKKDIKPLEKYITGKYIKSGQFDKKKQRLNFNDISKFAFVKELGFPYPWPSDEFQPDDEEGRREPSHLYTTTDTRQSVSDFEKELYTEPAAVLDLELPFLGKTNYKGFLTDFPDLLLKMMVSNDKLKEVLKRYKNLEIPDGKNPKVDKKREALISKASKEIYTLQQAHNINYRAVLDHYHMWKSVEARFREFLSSYRGEFVQSGGRKVKVGGTKLQKINLKKIMVDVFKVSKSVVDDMLTDKTDKNRIGAIAYGLSTDPKVMKISFEKFLSAHKPDWKVSGVVPKWMDWKFSSLEKLKERR